MMQMSANIEVAATRLSDPKLSKSEKIKSFCSVLIRHLATTLKTKIALELKDSKEIFNFSNNPRILAIFVQSLTGLLEKEPPSFLPKNYEQRLRSTVLEIINRIAFDEAFRVHLHTVSRTLLHIMRTDNEENALASLKIMVDLFKVYRNDMGNGAIVLFEIVRDVYANMEAVVRETFDQTGTPTYNTSMVLPLGSPKPSSPNSDPSDPSKPIPKGMFSFKFLAECPMLLRPFGSSHSELMPRLASIILPAAFEFLKLQAAPQAEAHRFERSQGNYFIGVSSNIKNRAAFSDFIVSQIKTLGFITLLHRNTWLNLKPVVGEAFEISLRLLCDCPPDFSSSRREIFAALNYLLCQEIRPHFLNHVNLLLMNQVMDWSGLTARESLKYVSYTVLADLLLCFQADLKFDVLSRATLIFIQGLHDVHLSYPMQTICVRLLAGLAERIAITGDRASARALLMHVLNAIVSKLESIKQTLPGIHKQLSESDPPRLFPAIDTLTADNIDDFDFEKIRPLWSGGKPATNAGELLREVRIFFLLMMKRLDSLAVALVALNPPDAPGEYMVGFTSDDAHLFARLFRDALKCVSLFSLERKEPVVLPLRSRDGSALCTDAPEALEIARALVTIFQKIDLAVFHDVMATNMDFYFEQFMENAQLGVLAKLLLANDRLRAAFLAVLLSALAERLPKLGGESEGIFCSRLLHLFGLAFQTVSQNPSLEHLLAPHLGSIVRSCFNHPPQSTEGTHHYLLLTVMFSNLTLNSLERSNAEVTQLLPQVVTDLLLALSTTSQDDVRDLLLELILMAYAAVAFLTPLLQHIVRPIILSLNSGPRLTTKALLTLESVLDSVSREYLDPVLEPAADQLLYAVTKHLKPLPYDVALSASAARVLGKLGSVNRAFLLHPPLAQSLDECDFGVQLEFDGRAQDFPLNLSPFITLAYEILNDPTADMFHKAQAFRFSRSCLALFLNTNPYLPEDVIRLRERVLTCLQSGPNNALESGALTRFIPSADSRAVALRRDQRSKQGESLQKVLASIVISATHPELRGEAMALREGLIAHFALIKVMEVLDADPELAGEMAHRTAQSVDGGVLVDLLVNAITGSNFMLRTHGITMLKQFEKCCVQLLGGHQYLSRLPVFTEICERLSACCYQEDWIGKERSYVGLTHLGTSLDLGREWLRRQEPRMVSSLLYVLKATTSTVHYDSIWNALRQIISKAHEYEEGMDRSLQGSRVAQLAGRVLPDLFSANGSLRSAVKAILQLCVELSGIELKTLVQPFAMQLHNLIFFRPMRSLPIGLMIGAFDAIAFLLDAKPLFVKEDEQFCSFVAECLALLDSEDFALKTRDERTLVKFRIKCMGVIMSALALLETVTSPNIMRVRAIRVFFKFLHSDTVEVAEEASHGLKQLLENQNKLPKDLLQDVLKPYLASISDYTSMTMAHLKGLARLLEILTHYFKLEIGAKLLDCLRYRSKSPALEAAAESYLPDHGDVKLLAAVLNVFAYLPPDGRIFLKDLVPATLSIEHLLRRSLASPLRTPLVRFLSRHAPDAVLYFYEHLSDVRHTNLFLSALNADKAGCLCREIMANPTLLIKYAFDAPAHRGHFVGIARACCRLQSDWLVHTPSVLERLVSMWRTPERLLSGSIPSLAQLREISFLSHMLISTIPQDASFTSLYFDLASALTVPTSADLTSVRTFLRTQALGLAAPQKRAIMAHFLQLPSDTPISHLAIFLQYLINPMLLVACVRGGSDQFLDRELIAMLTSRIWDGPMARIPDDFLRLGIIQLTTIILQFSFQFLEGSMKEVIRFGTSYIRVDDMVCRHAAHLLVARFIAAFGCTENIVMVAYSALLKTTAFEAKPMVRLALDAIATKFPTRLPQSATEQRIPVWVRYSKQSLGEETYNMSHMINSFQFIGRHLEPFFEYRKQFIPQMVYIMPKLEIHDLNPDAKGLLVQLAEMIYKWEVLQIDGDEHRAKRAKGAVSDSPKDITPLMKDIVMTSLVRLFCSSGEAILRKQQIMNSLTIIRDLLSLPSWAEAATPTTLFEEALRFVDSDEKKNSNSVTIIIFNLELLHVIVKNKPASWLRANLRGLRECLASCIRANNYPISCSLHSLLSTIFSADMSGEPELGLLQTLVEESVQKGLSDNVTLGSALTLLDTLHQPEVVDPLVATLTRLFQRLARDHITSPEKRTAASQLNLDQLRRSHSVLASSAILTAADSNSNSILLTLNILKRRISHLGDCRKTLLASMGFLLEKSSDQELLRSLFRVVSEWLLRASESFPTSKEKANLLVSMVDIGPRCDSQLLADYLRLILELYEDKNLAHSELTVKLECAFMLGTRADPPSTRGRFLALLDDSIPRPLPLRIKYILGVHDWEKLAQHYWIPQATYLLAGALRLGSSLRPSHLTLSLPSICLPDAPSARTYGDLPDEFQLQLRRFWASLKCLNVRDLILPVQHLAALRPALQSELWARLFASAWTTLSEIERSDTIKLTITLLSKPYHAKQAVQSPNVVQSLLFGLEECRPYVVLPPQLLKYLAGKYRGWFETIRLLEGSLVSIDANPDKDDALIRGSVEDALSDIFSQLGQHEDFYGLWVRRCKYPATGTAIKLTQLGLWSHAQAAFEHAQSLANKSTLPSCESEYCVWESQWVHCSERLQQWDILQDLGEAAHSPELHLRAKWHNLGFNADVGSFQTLLAQLDPVEVSPAFAPQLRLYHSLASLGKAPDSLPDAVANFSAYSQLAHQEIATRWCSLPRAISHAHIPLLTMYQQLTEASACPSLFNQLVSPDPAANIDKLLTLWRGRMPRPYDSLSVWADVSAWRQFFCVTVSRLVQPMPSGEGNREASPPAVLLVEKIQQEQAFCLNEFAKAARLQHQYRVCIDKLNKHHELPSVQSAGSFVKLIEGAHCHYAHPTELEKGLAMLNKVNIGLLSSHQKAEFFCLKGRFLAKLGQADEANRAFSTATQSDSALADVWAAWGQYNEELFLSRKEIELGAYAIKCFIQASGLYRCDQARQYIARIIYLLNLDDVKGSLADSLDPHKANLPYWYWIFFIPQLLNGMTYGRATLLKEIVLQIAKTYPQAVFFNSATALEEYSILRTLAKQPDGEESDSDVYKQAWDCVSEVMDSIKIHSPLFAMTAGIFEDALKRRPRSTPTEQLYQLTSRLANEAITLLSNRASRSESLSEPYNFSRLENYLQVLPEGKVREAFEADFVRNPPSLSDFASRMRRWRDRCELLLPRQSKHIFLDSFSGSMVNAEVSGLNSILIPGQYMALSEESRELIKVSRFLPRIQVIYRHCVAHYKLSIRGHNGEVFSFLLQNDATHISRREERIVQLAQCMNGMLVRNEGAVQRRLQFHLPHLIPFGHSLRMVQYKEEYVSLYEMYDSHCSRSGLTKDMPYLHNLKRMQEVQSKGQAQMLNLRQDIFLEITQTIPSTVAADFLMRRLGNHGEWWAIRSHLTSQLALAAVLTHTLGIGCRHPSQMLIVPLKGELWLQEAVPIFNQASPTLQVNEPVPFRFTPALQGIVTKRGMSGLFATSIVSSARALAEPLGSFLPLFMRDEYLFWMIFNKTLQQPSTSPGHPTPSLRLDPTLDPLKDSHDGIQRLVDEVAKRLETLSCNPGPDKHSPKSSKMPLDQPVTQLISFATNPLKLSQLDYSLMPWL